MPSQSSNTSFCSMLFSMPNYRNHNPSFYESTSDMYSFTTSSTVDCTLSLGTPSTRVSSDTTIDRNHNDHQKQTTTPHLNTDNGSHHTTNFCWDFLQSTKHISNSHKSNRGGNSNNSDTLLARRCANCDTTSTPLWRNGPRGPKSLCNACGIRFKKEERRASAGSSTTTNCGAGRVMEAQEMTGQYYDNPSWVHHSNSQKMSCFSPAVANEFRFIEEDDHHPDSNGSGISFLSWRLNVTDRPGLVHDFTR